MSQIGCLKPRPARARRRLSLWLGLGLAIAKALVAPNRKVWLFEIEDEQHRVELDYNHVTLRGKVIVDGKFITGWGWALRSREVPFEVGGKRGVLRFIINLLSLNKQECYIDGILIKESWP